MSIFGAVLAILVLNVYISVRIWNSAIFDDRRKPYQLVFVWLVPVLGALVMAIAHRIANEERPGWSDTLRWAAVLAVLVACVVYGDVIPEQLEWLQLPDEPTALQYETFLSRHPRGLRANAALQKLDALDWAATSRGDAEDGYRAYCAKHANGSHFAEARARWDELHWQRIRSSRREGPFLEYLEEFPDGQHRCDAASALSRIGHHRKHFLRALSECRDADARTLVETQLADYDLREERSFRDAVADSSAGRLEAHLEEFPDGLHAEEAGRRADAIRELEAGFEVALLTLTPGTQPRVPRDDVLLVIIDEGQHLQIVREAAESVFDGEIQALPLERSLAQNLADVARWKTRNPGIDVVVNMSWGYQRRNELHEMLFAQLASAGVVFVAAAGNDGVPSIFFPAAYDSVIGVGAMTPRGALTEYCNRGDQLDVCLVDRSDEARELVMRELLDKLGSSECAEVARLYQKVIDDRKRFAFAIMRFLEEEFDKQHIASGTSLAAGAFSGYLARLLRERRSVPIDQLLSPYRRRPGTNFVKLNLGFGTGSESAERMARLMRLRHGRGCQQISQIVAAMRDY